MAEQKKLIFYSGFDEGFKDIYERMANIIYINKDPRRKIDKVEILSRIYNIFKDKIQAVLRTTNKFLITELIKE